MQNFENNLDWFQLEKFTENELKIIFLQCYGQFNISSNDFNDTQKIDSLYQKTLDQIYESLQRQSFKTLTSQKIQENLLQFQKQIENPRYDFKGLEFEVYFEDVIKSDYKSLAFQISKAFYIDKLSMFFQACRITDQNIKILSLIFTQNKSIKNLKLHIGSNSITNQSMFYIILNLALNKSIKSIELEYNNCEMLVLKETTRMLSAFLHYKAKDCPLVEVNISGGFGLTNLPLIPQNLQTLQKIDLHVSNNIFKDDQLLINICSGLQNNQNLEVFSLDFKNNNLTQYGISQLANFLYPTKQESKLKELRLSLSGIEQGCNASQAIPKLGEVLQTMKQLYKFEINLNDFNLESNHFGQFLNCLKAKQGLPFQWLFISYSGNPNIKLEDEVILGEINAKNYFNYGINVDITNDQIKISNKKIGAQEDNSLTYGQIKQIGESVYNFPNCQKLDLSQFRANWSLKQQRLLKYIHITSGCNTTCYVSNIEDQSIPKWDLLDIFLSINKLQILAIYKSLQGILPISLPLAIYDLREDMDLQISKNYNL
ncbi:hypothetical protein TTHERM_00420860 (macronuclear) [Tetrahymena thermophila SB210]|uniref:Kinase domain protein n=1 Tax=Tetrahymena thermophila (strain SB210) TaxID=312017 RepID=I7M6R3_TETTS|nr:hypothetical protein TTHERM_00420860 [Tetrahymena thermophila SB210]EAR85678.1 hypothetical protein TTHERM_00420860 [Tetrahymena thermophila SB210]|eukprot:XP_001033341.1 hypothetical protein TTHERM_00420860 [Tetrahymena thermophila SB210]